MGLDPGTITAKVIAFGAAFLTVLILGPRMIAWLRVLKFGQNINEDAPERHQKKQGTPTMGGALFLPGVLLALAVVLLLVGARPSGPLLAVLFVFVAHGALGFTDDYLKVKRGKSLGLKARQKLAGQALIALAFVAWLHLTRQTDFTTEVSIWRGVTLDLGLAYYPLVVVLMIGLSNATNLTDGLDGLASGLAILTALGLAWTVYTFAPGYEQLPLFAYVLAGVCLGFLWYNAHPAKVFMGDTGSLALGASFTALAVVGKQEVLLLILCLVFILEMLSVLIQVSVFKATKGPDGVGRRVFKMTPLHHHFEKSDWDETQIVVRFWILGGLALALGLALAPSLSWMWGRGGENWPHPALVGHPKHWRPGGSPQTGEGPVNISHGSIDRTRGRQRETEMSRSIGPSPFPKGEVPDEGGVGTSLTEFDGKSVAVIGLARSGLACAEALTQLGARVALYDGKPAEQLADAIGAARALGIEPRVGGASVDYRDLDYVITSPGVPKNSPVLQEAVARGVPVLGEIEAAYRIAQAPILAITGTNGKTTTTVLLGEMLKAAGIETYIAGNIAAGELAMPLIKAAHLAAPDAAIVAEISSFQLEWISTFRPKVAALLNVTPDHGDRQTWDEYVAAKWRLFENQTRDDFAILHNDLKQDARRERLAAKLLVFGGATTDDSLRALCPQAEVKMPGAHNRENVLAAAAMATAFGVGRAAICRVAGAFGGVVHRLEYVATVDGVKYVNNSMCTNVAAFQKSLAALPEPKVVIAGGVFKGDDLGPIAQAIQENNVRALVLIGQSGPDMERAVRAVGYDAVRRSDTLTNAIQTAQTLAAPGDVVLLAPACASFDMFRDFEDRGDQFKAAVRALSGEH